MAIKHGISRINGTFVNSTKNSLTSPSSGGMFKGIVTDIILNDQHPLFKDYGEWGCIGSVQFQPIDLKPSSFLPSLPSQGGKKGLKLIAKPLTSNNIVYPTVNEICFFFSINLDFSINSLNSIQYFYLSPLNLWNQPNSNFMPLQNFTNQSDDQLEYETQVESYQSNSSPLPPPEEVINTNFFPKDSEFNPSQDTFKEAPTSPLLPFSGDVISQGRWGNSIRLGSTSIPPQIPLKPLNDWSSTGDNTDPIILIKNGISTQNKTSDAKPITEKVNEDLSSIYCTSTQKIPIETINNKFTSYSSHTPELPNLFNSPQVIINSDRLVFNAKKDHVLISGEKSIFLGANSSLNFNAGNNMVLECNDIKLGNNSATEPLILGDTFLDNLDVVFTKLDQLCTQLTLDTIWPAGAPVANGGVITVASSLKVDLAKFKANMSSYKSKVSKTK